MIATRPMVFAAEHARLTRAPACDDAHPASLAVVSLELADRAAADRACARIWLIRLGQAL